MKYLLDTNVCVNLLRGASATLRGKIENIAATALAMNMVLVTHNTKEFSRVKKLRLEDWEYQ